MFNLLKAKKGNTTGVVGGAIAVIMLIILANTVRAFIASVLGNFSATEQLILNVVVTLMLLGVLVIAGFMGVTALKGRRR